MAADLPEAKLRTPIYGAPFSGGRRLLEATRQQQPQKAPSAVPFLFAAPSGSTETARHKLKGVSHYAEVLIMRRLTFVI